MEETSGGCEVFAKMSRQLESFQHNSVKELAPVGPVGPGWLGQYVLRNYILTTVLTGPPATAFLEGTLISISAHSQG